MFLETKNRSLEEMEILFGGEEAEAIEAVAARKHGGEKQEVIVDSHSSIEKTAF